MILAGHETTATALFWSLYLLALDPADPGRTCGRGAGRDRQWRARVNVDRLKFTRAVVDETMRLYPPAFLIVRAAAGPDTIAGMPVKQERRDADRAVAVAPARKAVARSERLRAAALHDGDAAADRFAYLPFGVGARVCIGAHFALVEAVLALAKIDRRVPRQHGRQGAGDAGRRGDDAAGPLADVCHRAPVTNRSLRAWRPGQSGSRLAS